MSRSIERKMAAAYVGVLALIIMAIAVNWRASVLHEQDIRWESHTRDMHAELESVMEMVLEAQSSTRKYILTGQEASLARYRAVQASLGDHLRRLKDLTADSPDERPRLTVAERLLAPQLEFWKILVRTRRKQGMEAASRLMLESPGSQQVAAIRRYIEGMRLDDEGMLRRRHQTSEQSRVQANWAQAVLAMLVMAVLAGYFLAIRRHVILRATAERDLRQRSAELEVANRQLHSSELALAAAQKMAGIGSWELDLSKNELHWSDEVYRIFEIDKERFGASYEAFLAAIHPDDREKVNTTYTGSLTTQRPYRIVHRLRMADGRIKWVEERCESEFDAGGRPLRSRGTVQDITERTVIEETLQVKDNAIATSINAVAISNVDGHIYYVNPMFVRMWGYGEEGEILGKSPREFTGDLAEAEFIVKTMTEQGYYVGEITGKRKDGSVFPAEISASIVKDRAGRVTHRMASFVDISERKRTEEALRRSSERFELAVRATNDGIWDWDIAASSTYRSPRWKEILGYREAELSDRESSFFGTLHPDDKERVHAAIIRHLEQDVPFREEFRLRHKDGSYRWVLSRAGVVRDAAGRPTRMVGADEDITEKKRTTARESARLRQLEQLSELSLMLSGDPMVVFERVARLIGELFDVRVVCLSEISGKDLLFKVVYVDGEIFVNAGGCPLDITPCFTVAQRREICTYDHVQELFPHAAFLKDHNAFSYCGFPATDAAGRVLAVTCLLGEKLHELTREDHHILQVIGQRIATEIERSKILAEGERAAQQIRDALREKEVLLREVHHRVKNNLQVISSLLYLQSQKILDKRLLELLQDSQTRVASMALIHEQLYQSSNFAQVDFTAYARGLANSLRHSYGADPSRITLRLDVGAHVFDVGMAITCGLILNEVLSNSFKYAFPEDRAGQIAIVLRREREEYRLEMSDDGVGMPAGAAGLRPGSLGVQLIDRLVAQIGGTLERGGPPGTVYHIVFPAIGMHGE